MTPLDMIAEWRKGCSCASPERPAECPDCTAGLITALELWLRKPLWERIWLRSNGNAWLARFNAWRAFVHFNEPADFTRVAAVAETLTGTMRPLSDVCTPTELDSHTFRNHLALFVQPCEACGKWCNPHDLLREQECETCLRV